MAKKNPGWTKHPHEHNMARLGIETRNRDYVIRADGYADWAETKQEFTLTFTIKPNPRWSIGEYMSQLEGEVGGDKMDIDVDDVDIVEATDDDGETVFVVTLDGTALSTLEWDEFDPEDREELSGMIGETIDYHLENTLGGYTYSSEVVLPPAFRVGQQAKITIGSGLDSGKVVTIVPRSTVKVGRQGIPTNVEGAYRPVDWDREYAIRYKDGSIGTMFKGRLEEVK